MKKKKKIRILIILLIYITLLILGVTNTNFKNYTILEKIFTVPFLEILNITTFNNKFVIGLLFSITLMNLIIPRLGELNTIIRKLIVSLPYSQNILIYGRVLNAKEKDKELLEKVYCYSERPYKKFFYFLKLKEINISKLLLMPLYTVWTTVIMVALYQLPNNNSNYDFSFLWINDIRKTNIVISLIFIGIFLVLLFYKIIKAKENKLSVILDSLFNLTIIYFAFRSSIICIIGIYGILFTAIKKLGGKKDVK